MTEGKIWQAMLKLRIFTQWMVLKELDPPSYMRQHIKEKIRSIIIGQVKNGILEIYSVNPPVFGLPGQDIESIKRTCKICGSRFIPRRNDNYYCSEGCIKEYRRRYLENRRRQRHAGIRKRYSKEEEELILATFKNGMTSEKLQELSERLGRPASNIKAKYKYMKRIGVAS